MRVRRAAPPSTPDAWRSESTLASLDMISRSSCIWSAALPRNIRVLSLWGRMFCAPENLGSTCCVNHAKTRTATQTCPFYVLVFWDKKPWWHAPAPCYFAGICRPLPGSRHSKLKEVTVCCGSDLSVRTVFPWVACPAKTPAKLQYEPLYIIYRSTVMSTRR